MERFAFFACVSRTCSQPLTCSRLLRNGITRTCPPCSAREIDVNSPRVFVDSHSGAGRAIETCSVLEQACHPGIFDLSSIARSSAVVARGSMRWRPSRMTRPADRSSSCTLRSRRPAAARERSVVSSGSGSARVTRAGLGGRDAHGEPRRAQGAEAHTAFDSASSALRLQVRG